MSYTDRRDWRWDLSSASIVRAIVYADSLSIRLISLARLNRDAVEESCYPETQVSQVPRLVPAWFEFKVGTTGFEHAGWSASARRRQS